MNDLLFRNTRFHLEGLAARCDARGDHERAETFRKAIAALDAERPEGRPNDATLASAHLRDERQGSVLPMKPGEWRCVCGHINPPEHKRCHGCEQDRADG